MLLDIPLTRVEQENNIYMLIGCKNRICVTNDVKELLSLVYLATYYINILAQSRYLELKEREADEAGTTKEHTEINPNK